MATGTKTQAPTPKSEPTVKLVPLSDDEFDAIRLSGGPGRQAKPSVFLAEVREALSRMPAKGWEKESDGWFMVKETAANKNEVNARELRKAAKQMNLSLADADKIRVEIRPRKDHPKLGSFVAWRVVPAPVTAESESPSGGDSA